VDDYEKEKKKINQLTLVSTFIISSLSFYQKLITIFDIKPKLTYKGLY
jgi:hypothetical protein